MAEDALTKRHKRAVERVRTLMGNPPASYDVFLLNDPLFDMMAIKESEILVLKIVLDGISSDDIRLVRERRLSSNVTKKILKKEFKRRSFEEKIIK